MYLVAKLQPFDFKEKHPCPKCNRIFEKKGSLSRHLLYACGKKPRFKCPYCRYCCNLRSNVYRHVRNTHKRNEVYTMDIVRNCVAKPHWSFYINEPLTDLPASSKLKKTVEIFYAYFYVPDVMSRRTLNTREKDIIAEWLCDKLIFLFINQWKTTEYDGTLKLKFLLCTGVRGSLTIRSDELRLTYCDILLIVLISV